MIEGTVGSGTGVGVGETGVGVGVGGSGTGVGLGVGVAVGGSGTGVGADLNTAVNFRLLSPTTNVYVEVTETISLLPSSQQSNWNPDAGVAVKVTCVPSL